MFGLNKSAKGVHQRGTRVLDRKESAHALGKERRHILKQTGSADSVLSFAGVPLMPEDETQHFKCVGMTGTGKTTAISQLLQGALKRGDRAIIADPDGTYTRRFYDPGQGHIVLNPFLKASPRWNIFKEIREDYDIEDISRALIPDLPQAHDHEWRDYARTLFTSMTQAVWERSKRTGLKTTTTDLYGIASQVPVENLRELLAETPAAAFLNESGDRMFSSIHSVLNNAVKSLKYVSRQQNVQDFSIREWVQGEPRDYGHALFIPYTGTETESLKNLISTWIRLGIFQATQGQEEVDQRLWFVVDELAKLGPIGGMTDALTQLRKFGGRAVLGFQSIDQVRALYGRDNANAIVENCGNTLLLRSGAGNEGGTAEFASQLVGECDVVRESVSKTRSGVWKLLVSATTQTPQRSRERAMLGSEFEQLPRFHGRVRVGSRPDWLSVELQKQPGPIHSEKAPFLQRASTEPNARVRTHRIEMEGDDEDDDPEEEQFDSSMHFSDGQESEPPDSDENKVKAVAMEGAEALEEAEREADDKRPYDPTAVPDWVQKKFHKRTGDTSRWHFVQGNKPAFRDKFTKLSTHLDNGMVLDALIAIAKERGWKSINIEGSERFKLEIFIRAQNHGIAVDNFEPDQQQTVWIMKHGKNRMEQADKPRSAAMPESCRNDVAQPGVLAVKGAERRGSGGEPRSHTVQSRRVRINKEKEPKSKRGGKNDKRATDKKSPEDYSAAEKASIWLDIKNH